MLGADEVNSLLEAHGLRPRRSLGQNFVTDPGTLERIVTLSGIGPGSNVVEVGPGLGGLTLALAETGARVVAIEKDPALHAVLTEVIGRLDPERRPEVHLGDALTFDWAATLGTGDWSLVANLPYNVAVPIVIDVLERAPMVRHMWVMVQLDVAERLCATPGGRAIGVPTVKVGWHASARIVMTVSPEVFTPRPNVRSAVVRIDRRPPPGAGADARRAFALVERAYRQRRKMLRSSLGDTVDPAAFERSGVEPTARPEQLSVGQWAELAEAASRAGSPDGP